MRIAFGKILYVESETFSPIKCEVDEFKKMVYILEMIYFKMYKV